MEEHSGHRQRLRESFLALGAKAMPEHQLLELLLTYAIPRRDVNPLAHRLIERYGSLAAVLKADVAELKNAGLGEYAATLIALAGAMRNISEKPRKKQRLNNPERAAEYCMQLLRPHRYEVMYLVSLDSGLKPIHEDMVSSGTIDQSTVDILPYSRSCALVLRSLIIVVYIAWDVYVARHAVRAFIPNYNMVI